METWLVTGGAGFIGSAFLRLLRAQRPQLRLVNLDLLSYAADLRRLKDLQEGAGYRFVQGDVCDRRLLDALFAQEDFRCVVHFAAQSHVDRSIGDGAEFFRTNTLGTQQLLEAARRAWGPGAGRRRFLLVSTDEVYGALGAEGRFTEDSPLRPNSPYAASKAGADLAALAFCRTHGFPALVTRCCNNFGPLQHGEKLLPTLCRHAAAGRALPLYGSGEQVREWIHVLDHCRGLLLCLEHGQPGRPYNLGSGLELSNRRVASLVLEEAGQPAELLVHVPDRPGHDFRYALDHDRAAGELGFAPEHSGLDQLRSTIRDYLRAPS